MKQMQNSQMKYSLTFADEATSISSRDGGYFLELLQ